VPAYGTVILPLVSTTWSGSVTKLPGRAGLARDQEPPGSASKIVMLTTSPIPSVIRGGLSRKHISPDDLDLEPDEFGEESRPASPARSR
jgi:hypothetical protein